MITQLLFNFAEAMSVANSIATSVNGYVPTRESLVLSEMSKIDYIDPRIPSFCGEVPAIPVYNSNYDLIARIGYFY